MVILVNFGEFKMIADNKRNQKTQIPDGKTPGNFVFKASHGQPSKAVCYPACGGLLF